MALQRPGKFRWEVRQPNQQRIIADGRYLWIYDADLEQVTKQRLDFHHPGSPALLLSGSIRSLQKNFRIHAQPAIEGGEWFTLEPKEHDAMFQTIRLQFVDNKLVEMDMTDKLGQQSIFKFSHVKINQPLNPRLFRMEVPRGAEIVDNL